MTRASATVAALRATSLLGLVWLAKRCVEQVVFATVLPESPFWGTPELLQSPRRALTEFSAPFAAVTLAFLLAPRIARWRRDGDEPSDTVHWLRLVRLLAGLWLVATALGPAVAALSSTHRRPLVTVAAVVRFVVGVVLAFGAGWLSRAGIVAARGAKAAVEKSGVVATRPSDPPSDGVPPV